MGKRCLDIAGVEHAAAGRCPPAVQHVCAGNRSPESTFQKRELNMCFLKTFFKSFRRQRVRGEEAQQIFRQFAQTLMVIKSRRKSPRLHKVASH